MAIIKIDENRVEITEPVIKRVRSIDEMIREKNIYVSQVEKLTAKITKLDSEITEAKALGVKEAKDIIAAREAALTAEDI